MSALTDLLSALDADRRDDEEAAGWDGRAVLEDSVCREDAERWPGRPTYTGDPVAGDGRPAPAAVGPQDTGRMVNSAEADREHSSVDAADLQPATVEDLFTPADLAWWADLVGDPDRVDANPAAQPVYAEADDWADTSLAVLAERVAVAHAATAAAGARAGDPWAGELVTYPADDRAMTDELIYEGMAR